MTKWVAVPLESAERFRRRRKRIVAMAVLGVAVQAMIWGIFVRWLRPYEAAAAITAASSLCYLYFR